MSDNFFRQGLSEEPEHSEHEPASETVERIPGYLGNAERQTSGEDHVGTDQQSRSVSNRSLENGQIRQGVAGNRAYREDQGTFHRQRSRQQSTAINKAWDCQNLLALDGGGVRGYWTLLVLEKLMELIEDCEQHYQGPEGRKEPASSSFYPEEYQENVSQLERTSEERKDALKLETAQRHTALIATKRFLPCHYFDYIGGSSTGALIAIMLGRLRMTVADCLDEYENLASKVFGHPRRICFFSMPLLSKRAKYDCRRLERVFEEVTARRRERSLKEHQSTSKRFASTRSGVCRTFVTTIAATSASASDVNPVMQPHVLRSYHHAPRRPSVRAANSNGPSRRPTWPMDDDTEIDTRRTFVPPRKINTGDAGELTIPQVARAATAALCYFDPLKVDLENGRYTVFEDGGFGTTNNPTKVGTEEIQDCHGWCDEGVNRFGTILSIGTARSDIAKDEEGDAVQFIKSKLKRVTDLATSPEVVHREMQRQPRDFKWYYRLNPTKPDHLLSIPLDQWLPKKSKAERRRLMSSSRKDVVAGSQTMGIIRAQFNAYIADNDVRKEMQHIANELVGRRRHRILDAAKWERFAIGASFRCQQTTPMEDSSSCHEEFTLRTALEEHLRVVHGFKMPEIDRQVNRSMTLFRYQSREDAGGN